MQARTVWHPPGGTLGRLSARATARARALRSDEESLTRRAAEATKAPPLASALRSTGPVALIAEVKRRSPSKGALDAGMDAPARARQFERAGAAAISVLTEPDDFGGTNADLVAVRQATGLPVIRKDFHVDPVQLLEARALGASAALLIMRSLGPEGTTRMAAAARAIDLEAVFEVRSEEELRWALDAGAQVVGVNRRDLETLELEDAVLARILPQIPPGCLAIAESGISTPADVEEVARLGADAVLVGSSLSVTADIHSAVAALASVPRGSPRHG